MKRINKKAKEIKPPSEFTRSGDHFLLEGQNFDRGFSISLFPS
jgi:hypothetical protein